MSTSPSTPSAAGHTTAPTQGLGAMRRNGSAPAAGGDLFANLLSLLNAGGEAPLPAAEALPVGDADPLPLATKTSGDTLASAPDDNPLAALLAWSGNPLTAPTRPAADTTPSAPNERAVAPGANTPPVGEAPTPLTGAGLPLATRSDAATAEALNALVRQSPSAPGGPTAPTPASVQTAEQPTAPVEGQTLAERSITGATTTPATRITAWRSTTTLAHAGGHTVAGPAHAAGPRSGEQGLATGRAAEQVGEALSAPATAWVDTAASEPTGASLGAANDRPVSAGVTTGAPGITGDGTSGMGSGLGEGSADGGAGAHPDTPAPAQDAATPDSAALADDADPLADWTSPHVRHASVRVGEAGETPIDIQLSLDGQEVQVSFQTEDAQTRDSLAREAGAALGDLLQRSGMELGGVSVGGQGTSSQQQTGDQPAQPQAARASTAARSPTEARPGNEPLRPAPRRDGGRPLDLFV